MPLWLLLALIVPLMLAAVNMIDKLVVERHVHTTLLYPFYVGVMEMLIATSVLATLFLPGIEGANWSVIAGAMGMGSLR